MRNTFLILRRKCAILFAMHVYKEFFKPIHTASKNVFLFLSCVLCFGTFFSCNNVSNDAGGTLQGSGAKTIIFKGTASSNSALPSDIALAVSSLQGEGLSRSAIPSLDSSEYYRFVQAVQTDGSGSYKLGRNDQSQFIGSGGSFVFSLPLTKGHWEITAGIKKNMGGAEENDKTVLSDYCEKTLDDGEPVISHTFAIVPFQTGDLDERGSVELDVSSDPSLGANQLLLLCSDQKFKAAWVEPLSHVVTLTDGGAHVSITEIQGGTYEVNFCFLKSGRHVYSTVQTVCVFDNMKTDTWLSDGSGLINDSGVFCVTQDLVQKDMDSAIYVGVPAALSGVEGVVADSFNSGHAYEPLETLQAAVDKIAVYGNGATPYTIYVSGTVEGRTEFTSAALDGKAASITIAGYGEGDTIKAKMRSSGDTNINALDVTTSVPLVLKNIKVTKDEGGVFRGIYINNEDASVTLLAGAELSGLHSNMSQGGGAVVIKGCLEIKGGALKNNGSGNYGGGVYLAGNSDAKLIFKSGEISGNSSSSVGGGVYVDEGAVFEMTGGTISANSATNGGGAVFVKSTGVTLGGAAYIPYADGKNDVRLVGTNNIYLSGSLSKHSASQPIGVTIPDSTLKRNKTIVETKNGKLSEGVEEKFKIVSGDAGDGWCVERYSDGTKAVSFAPIYVAADAAYNATTNPQGYRVCKTAGSNSAECPGTKSKPYASLNMAVFELKDARKDFTIYIDGTVKGCTTVSGLSNDASNTSAWAHAKSLTISGATTFTTTATASDRLDCLDGDASGNTLYIMPMPVPITITSLKVTGGKSASDGGGIYLSSVDTGGATLTLAKDARVEGNRAEGNGAGVYVAEGATLNVLSNAYVYGNYNIAVDAEHPNGVDKGPSNVYLPAGKKINVTGALTATGGANGAKAKIGVTGEDAIAPGTTVVFTNGYGFGAGGNNAGVYPSAYFTGDKYTVALDPAAGGTESVLGVSGGSLIVEPFYEDITISVDKTQFLKSASKKEMTFSAKATAADGTETDVPIGSGEGKMSLAFEMTYHGETVPSTYHRLVEETANKLELVGDLPVGDYILTAVWIYNGKEYRSSFEVKIISELFTSKPKSLPAGTDGSVGTSGEYVYFGDWPQTLKDPSVTVDESNSMVSGAFTYYMGSDDCWYAKCKENAYESGYKYNDGTTPVAQDSANSYKFFKVEPIKWRVVSRDYESTGKALLVAEKILYSSVQYYDENGGMGVNKNRTIDGVTVYPNNYKHSKIRAYLNGINYNKSGSNCADYKGLGFLQSAFSASAQSLIKTTTVKNDLNSTKSYDNSVTYSDYICDNTSDKVFLLSLAELVNDDWFERALRSEKRIRGHSDFALANNLYLYSGGGYWWSRTPHNPSYGTHYGYTVKQDGDVLGSSPDIERKYFGIVPAICIDAP